MLIQKRAHEKKAWPDLWEVSAGGSALAGEDSWQAAEREVFEELGLKLMNFHPGSHLNKISEEECLDQIAPGSAADGAGAYLCAVLLRADRLPLADPGQL